MSQFLFFFGVLFATPSVFAGANANWLASYQIPVTDPSLAAFSTYVIDASDAPASDFVVTTNRIEFTLPVEMTGAPLHFVMLPQTDGSWAGTGVIGKCHADTDADHNEVCSVQFTNMPINSAQVTSILTAETSDPKILAQRLQVASIFSGELHGIITIRIP